MQTGKCKDCKHPQPDFVAMLFLWAVAPSQHQDTYLTQTPNVPLRSRQLRKKTKELRNVVGTQHIGIAEREAADKIIGKAKAGSTGAHIMRLLVSGGTERERPQGCFEIRMGAASPGPAQHFPTESSISRRGCPVFASPKALDPADWKRQKRLKAPQPVGSGRRKIYQEHRRWPMYTHFKDGCISGTLGQDSPGPGAVNVADHDPFRATSFLKTGICHPPLATPCMNRSSRQENKHLRGRA